MLPEEKTAVRVAIRVRPLSVREISNFQKPCLAISLTEPQVIIGTEKAFTFDYTFDRDSQQEAIFTGTTQDLVDGCFKGLNATILAYGQTGSGKTYTMGTGFDVSLAPENLGIVPRAVDRIFEVMQARHQESVDRNSSPPLFDVCVQFVELYQDDLLDLLDKTSRKGSGKKGKKPRLGEDKDGNVILYNVCKKAVSSREEILNLLKDGALARATGSTNMNATSSRSHAIFTIEIKQTIQQHGEGDVVGELLTTNAKFHFVDLAGSERLKRTNATGERQKEGISINSGLLALGNVISKLGDKSLKATHIPYRECKLTRLLQDSLGGNSRTLMVACVSPAEDDFVETLNTLRYANRAKNIQNRVVSNQDTTGQTISTLRARILELEMQVLDFQQGKRQPGVEAYNDMFVENNALQKENEELRVRVKRAEEGRALVLSELSEKTLRNAELRAENDRFKEMSRGGSDLSEETGSNQNLTDMEKVRVQYCTTIEDLEAKLRKANQELRQYDGGHRYDVGQGGHRYDVGLDSPGSPHHLASSSGGRTYRLSSRKTFSVPAGSSGRLSSSAEDFQIPSVHGSSPLANGLNLSDEDLDPLVSELDEKIRLAEEEMETLKNEMESQKENYEAKIVQLQTRIAEVEQERNKNIRDSASSTPSGKGGMGGVEFKERDLKYQQQLEELRKQLKEQHDLQTNFKKLQKDNVLTVKKLTKLEDEIGNMKRQRCDAMKKAEVESKKARLQDLERTRNLSHREKEMRLLRRQLAEEKERTQQLESRLTRIQAEKQILAKKANARPGVMSDQVAGRVAKRPADLDERVMKQNWEEFRKYFNAVAFKRMRLKAFEKQLNNYNEELRSLRESMKKTEKKLAQAVEQRDMKAVDAWRGTLEDVRSTIHFIEQKQQEVQNETAVCGESIEEYNNIDPVYINMKFPGEASNRYFLTQIMDLCMEQREEIMKQDNIAQGKAAEHTILVKERNVLREILQFYMVDSPNQAKVDIADVARKNLEENGVTDLTSDDVLKNIFATPTSVGRTSSRTKARQMTLGGPADMLVAGSSSSSNSSSSSTLSTSMTSPESDRMSAEDHPLSASIAEVSPATKSMPPPRLLPINVIRRDLKRSQEGAAGPSKKQPLAVTGYTIPNTTPLRPPNRSLSLTEISEQSSHTHIHKSTPSHTNSLENVIPHPQHPSPVPGRVQRHACQAHLNKVAAFPAHK